MRQRGFTLIELLVVIAIIGILAVALAFSFEGWVGGYRVEGQTKELHADLTSMRARAMMKNRPHFVVLGAKSYEVFEDTDPAPDGNGSRGASDTRALQRETQFAFITNGISSEFTFERSGLISASGTVRFSYDSSKIQPDYDCIDMRATRLTPGLWNGSACAVK